MISGPIHLFTSSTTWEAFSQLEMTRAKKPVRQGGLRLDIEHTELHTIKRQQVVTVERRV